MAKMTKLATINLAGAAGTLVLGDAGERAGLVNLQVVGAITATLTVQVSGDGTTWVAALARPVGSTTAATTITAAGCYQIEASGFLVRLSWAGSETGTPVIWTNATVG